MRVEQVDTQVKEMGLFVLNPYMELQLKNVDFHLYTPYPAQKKKKESHQTRAKGTSKDNTTLNDAISSKKGIFEEFKRYISQQEGKVISDIDIQDVRIHIYEHGRKRSRLSCREADLLAGKALMECKQAIFVAKPRSLKARTILVDPQSQTISTQGKYSYFENNRLQAKYSTETPSLQTDFYFDNVTLTNP